MASDSRWPRRRVLAGLCGTATASVAGCSGILPGGTETDAPDEPTATGGRTLLATDFEPPALASWSVERSSEDETTVAVSEDDELVVGVYRCNEAAARRDFGSVDGELTVDCVWESEAEGWWERPGLRILVDGEPFDYDVTAGSDVGHPDPRSTRTGETTLTADVDGRLAIEFAVRPSDKCANNNHGWTWLRVDEATATVDGA